MEIKSKKYINEGFNSKAYIINDEYILLEGVNKNSYDNYKKYSESLNTVSYTHLDFLRCAPCRVRHRGAAGGHGLRRAGAGYPGRPENRLVLDYERHGR